MSRFLTQSCRAAAAAAVLCCALAPAAGASAQTVRYGVIVDAARAPIAAVWNEDPRQVERAHCVVAVHISARRRGPSAVDSIFRVLDFGPVEVRAADPNHVDFECPPGVPELHTHSPATCPNDDPRWCVPAGPSAYSCQASRDDYEKLIARGDQFAIVQCDRNAFRFYYPSEYLPTPSVGSNPRPAPRTRAAKPGAHPTP